MRGIFVLTLFAVAGCASDSSEPAMPAKGGALSARFTERTVYGGEPSLDDTLRGAFDWTAKKGRATRRSRLLESRLIQLGTACYRRFDVGPWKRFKADDVDGLCDGSVFGDPSTEDDLIQSVASDWHEVGPAVIRGVSTTRYRGRLNIGAVKGTIELWVDGDGVVRRERQLSEKRGDFVSVREYFDFGVRVNVRAPKLGSTG